VDPAGYRANRDEHARRKAEEQERKREKQRRLLGIDPQPLSQPSPEPPATFEPSFEPVPALEALLAFLAKHPEREKDLTPKLRGEISAYRDVKAVAQASLEARAADAQRAAAR
jgi:hypothetical protein